MRDYHVAANYLLVALLSSPVLASCQPASLLLGPGPGSGFQLAAQPTFASSSLSAVLPAPVPALQLANLSNSAT